MGQPVDVSAGENGTLNIALFGEIDFSNSAEVVGTVHAEVAQARPATVRMEMAGVTFLDSSGIGVLVSAYRAASEVGAGYRVVGSSRMVYEQLRLTGLVELFGIDPPLEPVS
jgi:anti-sigma B factor antagonist